MGDLDTPGSQAGRFFLGSDVEILTKLNEQMDMWIGKKNLSSNGKFDQHPNFISGHFGLSGFKEVTSLCWKSAFNDHFAGFCGFVFGP